MDSLLCNEEWLMSPKMGIDSGNEGYSDECNASSHFLNCFYSSREECEETIGILRQKETDDYMPGPGYLKHLQANNFINNARLQAMHWMIMSQKRLNLCPETLFSAVNYLDRSISTNHCQVRKSWMFELLCISCLSIASKFHETTITTLHEFQAQGLNHTFPSSQIQRMELTVLKSLGWRLRTTTSYSYIELLIQLIDFPNKTLVGHLNACVTELLTNALLDSKFLEFKPFIVAMSAIRCVLEDLFTARNDSSLARINAFVPQDQQDDLTKCEMMMRKYLAEDYDKLFSGNGYCNPSSPVTVLSEEVHSFYDRQIDDISLVKMPGVRISLRPSNKRKRNQHEAGI